MARILLATFGSYGDVNPTLVLGRALRARGHEAVVATLPGFRGDIEGAGLGFVPMGPDIDPEDTALIRRVMDPRTGSEAVVRELVLPGLRDAYAVLEEASAGADLLVSHVLTFAVPLLAEKRGIPWVSTVLSPMVFFSPHDPPVPPPLPALGRLRALGPLLNRPLVALYKAMSKPWMAPVAALRRDLGLPPGRHPLFEGQHSPLGVLGLFSPAFGPPQPDWPRPCRVCGFLFRDSDFEGRGMDPGLARFLAEGPPPVVFTLGSSAVLAADGFYDDARAAARDLGVRAVLVAGPAAGGMDDLPPGMIALPSAPYHALFPAAAAVVHSGGIGTTAQALRAGRPQVVVSYAHDQFDNADRVRRLGAGVPLFRSRVTARRLASVLGRVLADRSMADRAAALGRTVAAEDGPAAACAAVEAVLAGRPP